MRYLFILVVIILTSTTINAQNTWIQSYSPWGIVGEYSVRNIAICQDGGYAVNGTYQHDFDPCTIKWGFLFKTDSDGNFLWAKQ